MVDAQTPRRNITFDRKIILQKVDKISFNEARRLKGPIYEALIQELNEEGCINAACHFEVLAQKERDYITRRIIRYRLSEDRALLIALCNSIKMAEKAAQLKDCTGMKACYTLLFEALKLLEPHKKYEWLLLDAFKITTSYCLAAEQKGLGPSEIFARIYYKYAQNLNSDLPEKIKWLQRAKNLTRGSLWPSIENADELYWKWEAFNDVVGSDLVLTMLEHARKIVKKNSKESIELAERAVLIVMEAGEKFDVNLLCRVYVEKAYFLLEDQQVEACLKILEYLQEELSPQTNYELNSLVCEIYLYEGMCCITLNKADRALHKLELAHTISHKYNLKDLEAAVLMNLGKVHMKFFKNTCRSKIAFEKARALFIELNDVENTKKTHFLLAKLNAEAIFPHLMGLVKQSKNNYCTLYSLQEWKNQCKPFWEEKPSEKNFDDSIECLLHADSAATIPEKSMSFAKSVVRVVDYDYVSEITM